MILSSLSVPSRRVLRRQLALVSQVNRFEAGRRLLVAPIPQQARGSALRIGKLGVQISLEALD